MKTPTYRLREKTPNRLFTFPTRITITLLALCSLLFFTNQQWERFELQRTAEAATQRLSVYETSLHATIDRHFYLPHILAADPRITRAFLTSESLQDERISALLARLNAQAGSDQIYLMDLQGVTHWSSNYLSDTSFVGNDYSFRPYFQTALNGAQGLYFAVGATSGKPGLFLSAPVIDNLDNITGVIVVKIDLAPLETRWLDSGDSVWMTDEHGIVFLSSAEQWHYQAIRSVPDTLHNELKQTKQYGNFDIVELTQNLDWSGPSWSALDLADGETSLLFHRNVTGYPWTMHLRLSLAEVMQSVRIYQTLVLLSAFAIIGALLYGRERKRRTQAQQTVVRLTQERESHQRAIIQNTDVGLINLNENFDCLFINNKARTLFGLDNSPLTKPMHKLLKPWRGDTNKTHRATGTRIDGSTFPVLVTLKAITVDDNKEYILTIQDISELTQTQDALLRANEVLEQRVEERTQDLKKAQQALAQNQKLAALGRMSSAIAHEINQPITALSNYIASSQLLLNRGDTINVADNLGRIESMIQRLSRLSRQLKIFSGKRNTGTTSVSLTQPIFYALDLLADSLKENNISCELKLDSEVMVQANTMFLEQILVNLISNAIDALRGQSGAKIRIGLTPAAEFAHGVALQISDNGPGLNHEQRAHLFEPFYTTKEIGKGLGLGLAISYNLAQDMGAALAVSNSIETTFTLTFNTAQWINKDAS